MERVQGIGGFFFRSPDREALCRWYASNLGLEIDETWWGTSIEWAKQHDAANAQTVWSVFKGDTTYFGGADRAFMVNFRVRDLDAMLKQLRDNGCAVEDKVEDSDFGRFGWVTDPDGNRVELWQPPA